MKVINRGMTLIELLIAMAIFAVMSASIFIAFDSFQKTREVTDKSAAMLKRYQLAFNILARDIQQMVPRPVRDEFGSLLPLPALRINDDQAMEFSRGGWNRSPFSKAIRPEIQRVAYYVEDKRLYRASWQVLDRAEDTVPVRTPLLKGVEYIKFEMTYQNADDEWKTIETWPPQDLIGGAGGSGTFSGDPVSIPRLDHIRLPRVVTVTLRTEDFGEIYRKFLVASDYFEMFYPTPARSQGASS